ncbi:MAG: type VI secretion system protein ImpL, partial [Desulfobacteraceae bacterium]|nr:type VI secretion system protein ImpL [Desulfobacteraceae bacterium]
MKFLLKGLKFFLLFVLAIALFCTPILITVSLGETAFTGLLISISILSVVLLFILLRVLWARWREKKFINGLLQQDKEEVEEEESVDETLSEEISQRWKDAVADLKKSNLKNHGNPLYVLPWYMLIGESASGKTTSIKNSGLTSKYASPEKTSGVSGTKNCDWWFFEQAIIIDTAGRYAVHQEETSDEEEWQFFLSSLGKYRKKEPLNGLIITISADKLLNSSPDAIEDEGKKIRVRIEELMQSLGAKFPVYVLVTKCDLIYGMKQFFEHLPKETYKQAFGYINKDNTNDAIQVVDKTFESTNEILGQLRLRLSNTPGNDLMPHEVLLFPEEFAKLQSGFKTFVDSAFNLSIYQEQPYFRGIYFSSATQSGETYSHFIENTDFDIQKDHDKSDNSFFLFDFFTKILPSDRNRFSLTQRAVQWKKRIKFIKHSAWITAMIAL